MKTVEAFAARKSSPIPNIPILISVDPGRHTGFACWAQVKPYTLVACGVGAPPYEKAVKMAIEIPQIYGHSPVPPNDLITLATLAGRYIGHFGGETQICWPHEWKHTLPKNVCENRCRMKLTTQELAVTEMAEEEIPKSWHGDLWDSIGIGLYAFRGIKL